MDINYLLDSKVSYQANSWANISSELTIGVVLNEIRDGKYKGRIEELRNKLAIGDREYYNSYKMQLPAVTFSATFNQRRLGEDLKNYNSLVVIDIDKLEEEQILSTHSILLSDEYVFSFWRSPSNKGFKGLVSIEYNVERNRAVLYHRNAFKTIAKYFDEKYNLKLDTSGIDVTRLCFLSFDQSLVLKSLYNSFNVKSEELFESNDTTNRRKPKVVSFNDRDALYNPSGKNNVSDRKTMSDIIRYLKNKGFSITFSYYEWYKVAMSISNSFTYDVGLNYFLKLSAMDSSKFNELECTNFLASCFEGRNGKLTFSTIVYMANEKGFKTKYQKNGVPKVEG